MKYFSSFAYLLLHSKELHNVLMTGKGLDYFNLSLEGLEVCSTGENLDRHPVASLLEEEEGVGGWEGGMGGCGTKERE